MYVYAMYGTGVYVLGQDTSMLAQPGCYTQVGHMYNTLVDDMILGYGYDTQVCYSQVYDTLG